MPESGTEEAPAIPKCPTGPKARGKRLWRDLHASADFSESPETQTVIEEACYLADEVDRLRRLVRSAAADTRVSGYNGQQVSMPEVDDLRKSQSLLLAMLSQSAWTRTPVTASSRAAGRASSPPTHGGTADASRETTPEGRCPEAADRRDGLREEASTPPSTRSARTRSSSQTCEPNRQRGNSRTPRPLHY